MTKVEDFSGATVLVAGLGVSGRSACTVLRDHGATVLTFDERKPEADYHAENEIEFDRLDAIMTSPVFAPSTPFLQEAARRGLDVMSEVELAWRLRVDSSHTGKPASWIGITGTNGKTSTTEMTSEMLRAAGLHAPAVGNIGTPVSAAAVDPCNDALAVELSSFQMHYTDSLELDCAAITNLADDHLDWHGGFENYAADKAKVYHGVKRALVYNADDERVSELAMAASPAEGCRRVGFTLHEPHAGQIGVEDGWIVDRSGLRSADAPERVAKILDFAHLTEPDGTVYPHLLADALCALALVLGRGIPTSVAVAALKAFKPGGHRIVKVAEASSKNGVIRFVDDSKATNAHAARASLSSFGPKSVVWIAGGLAKGSRFEDLVADQAKTIRAAVVIGVDQEPMKAAFAAKDPDIPLTFIEPEPNDTVMDRAVEAAGAMAEPGDVVLMAPACASMDQFRSYADRGDRFAKAARRWVTAHAE
ncbi:UDP-N-acetylmuramoyl-L-alanine--D-glutamate ligase [Bifidobacterium primatium]|uniref:UDP-N-acetylmuramoylalanine--D-glutamate ligase n=1 Tax=Bifidobacterium primatium TaxID=2045438 RepID=A0A2M9H9Y2_9BIFI|nr:UDP-N-acetylmuramoyl-L-alanine--D-glutamate ligase [Bifidobacterium primatium]PJM73626.1 UDP-N-acetylmuramoyl-L-alanine--D-glutamate ligase [Bifidobacterium primatium]